MRGTPFLDAFRGNENKKNRKYAEGRSRSVKEPRFLFVLFVLSPFSSALAFLLLLLLPATASVVARKKEAARAAHAQLTLLPSNATNAPLDLAARSSLASEGKRRRRKGGRF